ncbi:MAG: NAD(P)-dependent oxidoreductase [Clostridiales bacterium]|nr:NAD(P)-dependent oxidoreductase [Clostridiales bacterium]
MKTLLITGATGFVGREVVRQLIRRGKEVTALGRTAPDEGIGFIKADLTDAPLLEKALEGKTFDCIMHIASLPGDTGNPQEMINVNVNGCLNLLEYARKSKSGRVVIAGSISAYEWYPATKFNPPDYMPVNEEHPCRPKDMYSTTKRMQELLAITYYKQYGVPTVVLRLTAVVGPRGQGGGRGWREFAEKLAEGKNVQIPHFSGNELCHYVDIRDVADMFITAGERPGAIGEIFNCCGARPVRGYEFAAIVRSIVPAIEVEYGFPWSMAQGGEISFDMSKAERLMGFKPIYSLEKSIRSIKEWIDAGGLEEKPGSRDQSFESGVNRNGK